MECRGVKAFSIVSGSMFGHSGSNSTGLVRPLTLTPSALIVAATLLPASKFLVLSMTRAPAAANDLTVSTPMPAPTLVGMSCRPSSVVSPPRPGRGGGKRNQDSQKTYLDVLSLGAAFLCRLLVHKICCVFLICITSSCLLGNAMAIPLHQHLFLCEQGSPLFPPVTTTIFPPSFEPSSLTTC